MDRLAIPVEGMSCGGCTGSVKRAIERLAGVQSANATLAPAEVVVEVVAGGVGVKEIVDAITRAGYDVPAEWRNEKGIA